MRCDNHYREKYDDLYRKVIKKIIVGGKKEIEGMTDEAWKETEKIDIRVEIEEGRGDRNKDMQPIKMSILLTHAVIGSWRQKRNLDSKCLRQAFHIS